MNSRNISGFSLIELLIVIAIIGIIAAIAVPNLLASRRSANGASMVQTLRTLHSAQAIYEQSIGQGNFSSNLQALGGGTNSSEIGVLDSTIVAATTTPKSGFVLTNLATVSKGTTLSAQYSVQGTPSATSGVTRTGNDSFFINESGILRRSGNSSIPANSSSSPIGQ
jgi:type IV pilus assembly protein PilA